MSKSVQSINQCKSVIRRIYDIVKVHGVDLKVETKDGERVSFLLATIAELRLPAAIRDYLD